MQLRQDTRTLPRAFNRKLFLLLFYSIFILLSCARFDIKTLKANLLFSLAIIPANKENPNMQLQVKENENLAYNLPLRPVVLKSNLYVSDPDKKMVKIFSDNTNKAKLILAKERPSQLSKAITYKKIDLGIPGWLAIDRENEYLYIQSFEPVPPANDKQLEAERRLSGQHSRIFQSPSLILKVNKRGNLISKIGREGINGTPFSLILQIHTDANKKLYVLHKDIQKKELELIVFKDSKLLRRYTMPDLRSESENNSRKNIFILEHIQAIEGKNFVIGSVAIRKKSDFSFIKRIIYYQKNPEDIPQILLDNDNPSNYLTWADSEGKFYMHQTEESGSKLLFKIFSKQGKYLKNWELELPELRSSWKDIFINLQGQILSTRIVRDKFMVYEWE